MRRICIALLLLLMASPAFAATLSINWNNSGGVFPTLAGNMLSSDVAQAGQQTTDANVDGVPDSTHAELLGDILAHDSSNGGKPWHDAVYNAFVANRAKLNATQAIITANSLTGGKMTDYCCLFVTIGDDASWNWFLSIAGGIADYFSITFNPVRTDYVGVPELLSVCSDLDGDTVNNIREYFGQSRVRADFVAAAQNDATAVAGCGPFPCAGNVDCLIPGISYTYDSANQKVYLLTPLEPRWTDAEAYAQNIMIGGMLTPSHLVAINSLAENNFCKGLAQLNGNDLYIGCTDKEPYTTMDNWVWVDNSSVVFFIQNPTSGGTAQGGAYANWNSGEPNGDGEFYGEIRTDGKWNDVYGDNSTEGEENWQKGIVELAGTYADTTPANGVPDAFETLVCLPGNCGAAEGEVVVEGEGEVVVEGEGEVAGPCAYEGLFNDPAIGQGPLLMLLLSLGPDWTELDILGNGFPQAAQMALVEYALCHADSPAHDLVAAGFATNKALFASDVATLAALNPTFAALGAVGDLMPALIGSSTAMKFAINALVLDATSGVTGLPNYDNYVVFTTGGKAPSEEMVSADGDFDGDGISNLDEWVAALGNLSVFTDAATNPWIGPPVPVGGMIGLAVLMGAVAAGGSRTITRRKK